MPAAAAGWFAEQVVQRGGDVHGLAAQAEGMAVVEEVVGGQAADAGGGLGEQQQQQSGGAIGGLQVGVVHQAAHQGPALVLGDDLGGEVAGVERRRQGLGVMVASGPAHEAAHQGAHRRSVGEPGVQFVLGAGGEAAADLLQPFQQPHHVADLHADGVGLAVRDVPAGREAAQRLPADVVEQDAALTGIGDAGDGAGQPRLQPGEAARYECRGQRRVRSAA
ncbi:hypothetical protein B9W64_05865 [Streptomyces sp. CS159]|nr:hypothetical protein [Streptomyces sp. UP1A-1]OWA21118.1 hypothetical protein B9W64_05865 [Streptomyces sp. CS159]